jgi:Ca2+-binding EF-hand superfamily protein
MNVKDSPAAKHGPSEADFMVLYEAFANEAQTMGYTELKALLDAVQQPVSAEHIVALIKQVDTDGDAEINFNEFVKGMTSREEWAALRQTLSDSLQDEVTRVDISEAELSSLLHNSRCARAHQILLSIHLPDIQT